MPNEVLSSPLLTELRLGRIAFARKLRRNATDAEAKLWRALRDRRLRQFKFRRQHSIPPYVLDFYCHQLRLAVELDGGGHLEKQQRVHDERRDHFLREQGIDVVRLTNFEMLVHEQTLLDFLVRVVTQRAERGGGEG